MLVRVCVCVCANFMKIVTPSSWDGHHKADLSASPQSPPASNLFTEQNVGYCVYCVSAQILSHIFHCQQHMH